MREQPEDVNDKQKKTMSTLHSTLRKRKKKKPGHDVATMSMAWNEYKNCMMTIAVEVLAGWN
jgi:hypothetical protein